MPLAENFADQLGSSRPSAAKSPTYRLAPHNIEAEQALLGAILVNNDAFDRVSDFLKPEHFSEELHRRIFDVDGQADSRRQARLANHARRLFWASMISAG